MWSWLRYMLQRTRVCGRASRSPTVSLSDWFVRAAGVANRRRASPRRSACLPPAHAPGNDGGPPPGRGQHTAGEPTKCPAAASRIALGGERGEGGGSGIPGLSVTWKRTGVREGRQHWRAWSLSAWHTGLLAADRQLPARAAVRGGPSWCGRERVLRGLGARGGALGASRRSCSLVLECVFWGVRLMRHWCGGGGRGGTLSFRPSP